jgi:signal transduction protein with GAF and PtsI domain
MVSMQTTDDPGGANGDLSREQQFLAVFQKVTRLTSLALDHQEVMDTIARGLPELLAIDACTIRLIDASIGSFVLGAAHGVSLEYLSRDVIDSEDTMAMIRSGYPVFSDHVDQDAFLPFHAAASREGVKSVLTLPILYQGALIGIMRLLTRSARSFASEEISFAMALAEQVGIAISHGRMFKEMEAQLTFLREIQGISALVNSTLDLDGILNALVERAALTMRAKGCTILNLGICSWRRPMAFPADTCGAARSKTKAPSRWCLPANRWPSTTSATISASTITRRWRTRALFRFWRFRSRSTAR